MNDKQIEVMQMRIHPAYKLAMIAMLEKPRANRNELSYFMNVDKTQLSNTTKKLSELGLVKTSRVDDSARVMYEVLI